MSTALAPTLFDRSGWWDPACREFASLRAVSRFRLDLLRQWLPGSWAGRRVVDLGCGGGLLAVPLAAAGARVLGVDLAQQALRAARARGEGGFQAVAGDLQALPVDSAVADVVLLADVLEHVSVPGAVVAAAARLLAPGGHLFVNTIHRTWRSRWFAITLGEGLGFIPRGTHRWDWFVTPDELDRYAGAAGLVRVQRCGEAPRLWRTLRSGAVELRASRSLAVGYGALYRRQP
jgi:2-polyprenyl-6-hydroxyphenyl methylase/3-demethylubiquinone-9 3-methyltransferase